MKLFFLLFFTLSITFFLGCSTRGHKIYKEDKKENIFVDDCNNTSVSNNSKYKTRILYEEYKKWDGTPYKLGGISLNGVDCSSFIQQIYYNAFGLRIPRTTTKQLKIGHTIKKEDLRIGDMIFFKTGWNVNHVGIIIEDGSFVHASTSQGVMISSIHNPYWKNNYFQSRRILP